MTEKSDMPERLLNLEETRLEAFKQLTKADVTLQYCGDEDLAESISNIQDTLRNRIESNRDNE